MRVHRTTYGALGAAGISLTTLALIAPVLAQDKQQPATTPVAASALAATPGAKAVIDRKQAQAEAVLTGRSVQTYRSTGATLHAENNCILADLGVSRYVPSNGNTTSYLNYNVVNFCDEAGNASGSLEIPDLTFTGDPRTEDSINLTINLTSVGSQVFGPPLVANITWTKNDDSVSRSTSTGTTTTKTNGFTKVSFKTVSKTTTADIEGSANNLFPMKGATGNISWDNTTNTIVVR